jgi:hypothetical protein
MMLGPRFYGLLPERASGVLRSWASVVIPFSVTVQSLPTVEEIIGDRRQGDSGSDEGRMTEKSSNAHNLSNAYINSCIYHI